VNVRINPVKNLNAVWVGYVKIITA